MADFRSHQALFVEGSYTHNFAKPNFRKELVYLRLGNETRHRLAPANADKLVDIFPDLRAIRTMQNVHWNEACAADMRDMLLKQDNVHASDSESSASSESSDSDMSLSRIV